MLCKDYYEIFGVEKIVIEIELNKVYRKLVFLMYLDKNKVLGVKEVF